MGKEEYCFISVNGIVEKKNSNVRLSDVLLSKQYNLPMPCGGQGRCGKCKIIAHGEISALSKEEKIHLSKEEIDKGIRLACCAYAMGNAELITLDLTEAQINSLTFGEEIRIDNPLFDRYGLAIDIGTTTLVVELYGRKGQIAKSTAINPQTSMGADVISRIEKAIGGERQKLMLLIIEALNQLIDQVCKKSNISSLEIDGAVVTGNTTMLYLLIGKNPVSLSAAPFKADFLFGSFFSTKEIPINISGSSKIYIPQCIGAFVGADTTTAILASGLNLLEKPAIMIDVGTNGEVALWNGTKLVCTSTAAGPAFEGAILDCGNIGVSGAIDKIWEQNNSIVFSTINGAVENGICGSGIIDGVALLKKMELIDETGTMDEDKLRERGLLINNENGLRCRISQKSFISQDDIRNVQLAKSAICAGIKTLVATENLQIEDISAMYIAGGFGNYMNIDNAQFIGLFPSELRSKIKIIGNAALKGAEIILCNKDVVNKVNDMIKTADAIDLSTISEFSDYYIDGMII